MPGIDRRDFLKITAIAGAGFAASSLLGRRILAAPITIEESRQLMGTLIHLKVVAHSEEQGEIALASTFGEMERLIALFDHRNSSSEIALLNRTQKLPKASSEFQEVLEAALHYSRVTQGAFDVSVAPAVLANQLSKSVDEAALKLVSFRNISVAGNSIALKQPGMSITLDGIAKGFIVDKGVAKLNSLGFDHVLVEAGGDLMVSGENANYDHWQIGVAHPRPAVINGYLANFTISDSAAATSGDYLNSYSADHTRHHIVDPQTGRSPSELASVTTIASSAMEADALSTGFMVCGVEKSLQLLHDINGVEALFVTKDLQVFRTSGFPE